MKRSLKITVARTTAMGALTVLGAILMGAAAPASCVVPEPDPCTLACAEPAVCGADGVTYGCGVVEAECRGVAVWYEGPCSECVSDDECGAGRHCSTSDGDCLPAPGCGSDLACPAVCAGICVDDPPACASDAECAAGEYCAIGPCPLAPCVESEDGTWICPDCPGSCQPRPAECDTAGTVCRNGDECVIDWCEPVECPPGADCAWIESCYGHCEPPAAPCDTFGNECRDGETCVYDYCTTCPEGAACLVADGCFGHCEAAPPPPPPPGDPCLSDLDCGPGGYCAWLGPCPLAADGGFCAPADCGPCYGTCLYPEPF